MSMLPDASSTSASASSDRPRRALVTGAASGIGWAIASALAASNRRVILCDVDAEGGARRAETLDGASFVPLDVADNDACRRLADDLAAGGEQVDLLVNNAGIGSPGTGLTSKAEELDRLWRVNVAGVFNLTTALLPGMVAAGGGSIINMASVGGVRAIRDRLAYCTTKHAVVGFTRCIASTTRTRTSAATACVPDACGRRGSNAGLQSRTIRSRHLHRCVSPSLTAAWSSPKKSPRRLSF